MVCCERELMVDEVRTDADAILASTSTGGRSGLLVSVLICCFFLVCGPFFLLVIFGFLLWLLSSYALMASFRIVLLSKEETRCVRSHKRSTPMGRGFFHSNLYCLPLLALGHSTICPVNITRESVNLSAYIGLIKNQQSTGSPSWQMIMYSSLLSALDTSLDPPLLGPPLGPMVLLPLLILPWEAAWEAAWERLPPCYMNPEVIPHQQPQFLLLYHPLVGYLQ
jgi:hypothetical protein